MSGNEDFALGSPPLSGTVDRRIVTQKKHVRWERLPVNISIMNCNGGIFFHPEKKIVVYNSTCATEARAVVSKQSLNFSADYSNPLQKQLEQSALHCSILPF
ncbi:hypothetical protein CDAR_190361 [Caerostris darwini]|uniref:Uncharacterized protein n=1 Tax=Caerostris darwini TaxID=1538125 RepID=A0AAV4MLB1_9ARAC|nr:hypothetical protein CDAR_190361 [Caerostris darwini]